ncbi:DNA-binding protein [Aliarcobacter butzleri]|uniref:DNA-binding protein n=1 Tax=Aliarcobacter butzleri TaxID=28197 RepID=UPI00125FF584|nr:DNA-binding protein [Aliarcobacter butzleri]
MEVTKQLPRKQRPKQAAENYGVGLSTIWLYIKQGKLSATKISEKVTVLDTQELEQFFNGAIA